MKVVAPAIGAIATLALFTAPAADAKSKFADIRVVTNTGETLAEHRQYTEDVKVKASEDADCFGPDNPSSDDKLKLDDPTVLGTLIDSSKSDKDLKPLSITDAFFNEFGSFGVCGIGSFVAPAFVPGDPAEPYWYNAVNGVGAGAGPNQIPTTNGDRHLWYFATGAEAGFPSELSIDAPTAVLPDDPFTVTVTRLLPDGTTEPAEGAVVGGETTDADGTAELAIGNGTTEFVATGGPDDVFSPEIKVCAANELDNCPSRFGIRIFGTDGDDKIKSTRGADEIDCGRGKDTVKNAKRSDDIAKNCEKVKR